MQSPSVCKLKVLKCIYSVGKCHAISNARKERSLSSIVFVRKKCIAFSLCVVLIAAGEKADSDLARYVKLLIAEGFSVSFGTEPLK